MHRCRDLTRQLDAQQVLHRLGFPEHEAEEAIAGSDDRHAATGHRVPAAVASEPGICRGA
jgi:hypothetical protein